MINVLMKKITLSNFLFLNTSVFRAFFEDTRLRTPNFFAFPMFFLKNHLLHSSNNFSEFSPSFFRQFSSGVVQSINCPLFKVSAYKGKSR